MQSFDTTAPDDDRFIQAYVQIGAIDRVAKIWETRVKKNPDNPQYHFALAGAYLALGNREGAIEHIKKAIELNPELKDQGEYYIKEIRAGRNP